MLVVRHPNQAPHDPDTVFRITVTVQNYGDSALNSIHGSAIALLAARHQAPGPHLDPGGAAVCGEQVAIERIVGVFEEGARAAVAALGHMVRMIGDDDTGKAGHVA
jgi:hypothetical protein